MKIFTCPKEVPAPVPDYENYDSNKQMAAEEKHEADLKAWLKKHGYPGKYTGEIYSVGVADGSANYMVADGRTFCLIHLPYGDAYQSRDVAFLPKKEIIRRIEADKKWQAAWKKATAKETATT
jgi:hypothetical protein